MANGQSVKADVKNDATVRTNESNKNSTGVTNKAGQSKDNEKQKIEDGEVLNSSSTKKVESTVIDNNSETSKSSETPTSTTKANKSKTETDLKKNDSVSQKGSNTEAFVDKARTTQM